MDPIIFAQLNAAYHNSVYGQRVEEIDKRRAPKELVDRLSASREGHMAQDGPNKPAYDAKQRILKRAHKKRTKMKEDLDLYYIVSEYLVSEGFCDSYEDADVIMTNMSEEWRDSILDEVTGGGQIRFRKGQPGRSPKKSGMVMTPQQKAANKLGRMDVDPTTDPERRVRQARVALR